MPIVTEENVLKLLYAYNPWWRDGFIPAEYVKATKRFAYHETMKNLIYISNPVNLDGKKVLKSKPKIYIADAAIRNGVLMFDQVLFDDVEMGIMVETSVYKHLASFYYRSRTNVDYYRRSDGNKKEINIVVEFPGKFGNKG